MPRVLFDYSELDGRITMLYKKREAFGQAMGWSKNKTSLKLNCHSYFTMPEINMAAKLLNIPDEHYKRYFFTERV